MEERGRRRVSGVDRVFQLLDHLTEREGAARPIDIARAIGAPSSTVYEIVEQLVAREVLRRDETGAVGLGPKLMHYGLAYRHATPLFEVAHREMRRLAAETGESVQICGRDGDMMVVLAMAEGAGHFRVTSHVGTRIPLNWTASGRLLVGHLPEEERRRLFARAARPSPTGRAETDPTVLSGAAAAALAERISIQLSESDYAVACIAAPVVAPSGACLLTISIVLPEAKAGREAARWSSRVREAAAAIERAMGWAAALRA
jgi:DNA-binding IclR family transcriptional regulator